MTGSITQHAQVAQYTIPTKSFSVGTNNFTVPLEGHDTLPPGNYKTVRVLERSILNLDNGIYNIDTFIYGNDTRLILDYSASEEIVINANKKLTIGELQ